MALVSLRIGTGSQEPVLLDYLINTKLSNFCLIYASSESSGESVHWHNLNRALVALKYNKYKLSRFFSLIYWSSECSGKIVYYFRLA